MSKRGKNMSLAAVLLATLLISVTACNNASNDAPAPKHTLTVSVCYDFYEIEVAIERFKALHPDVEIVLHKYDNDWGKYRQQITTQLLGGTAGDIVDATGFSPLNFAASSFLADFYPLMQNDPAFNESDYYMNVFDGMAYKGRLVVFPTSFAYRFMGVNNSFSATLTERYRQYDIINYRQILDLYNSVPDKGGRYLNYNFDATSVIDALLTTYVDFENRTCHFDDADFVRFLADAKNATNPQKVASGELGGWRGIDTRRAGLVQYALQNLFFDVNCANYEVFFPYEEAEVFTHYIPIANETGQLLLSPSKPFCISEASENKELAWEFVKFMTTPEANQDSYIPSFPVHRELFRSYIAAELSVMVERMRTEEAIVGETTEVVDQVIAIYERYNEMPMEYQQSIGLDSLIEMMRQTITQFYLNVMTAEQVASELQNKVSLYLME